MSNMIIDDNSAKQIINELLINFEIDKDLYLEEEVSVEKEK